MTFVEPAGDAAAAAAGAACHVMQLVGRSALDTRHQKWAASSPTLGEDDVAQVKLAAAVWRDRRHAQRRLRELQCARGWAGLAVVVTLKRELPIPPPLDVPVEPLELDESSPGLSALGIALGTDDEDAPHAPARRAARRWLVRIAPFALIFCGPLVQALGGLAAGNRFIFQVNLALLIVGLAVSTIWAWLTSGRWFLVPGGVVRRRTLLRRFGVGLDLHRPVDTLLLLTGRGGLWTATLSGARNTVVARFTRREAEALLAAWQSPLPRPSLEQLSDLR